MRASVRAIHLKRWVGGFATLSLRRAPENVRRWLRESLVARAGRIVGLFYIEVQGALGCYVVC